MQLHVATSSYVPGSRLIQAFRTVGAASDNVAVVVVLAVVLTRTRRRSRMNLARPRSRGRSTGRYTERLAVVQTRSSGRCRPRTTPSAVG